MSTQLIVTIALLAGAVFSLIECWRLRGLRRVLGLLASLAAPLLFYLLLYPPPQRTDTVLAVLTAGTTPAQIAQLPPGARRVALPGAAVEAGIEQVPDLATALRRHPDVAALHVTGLGLGAADRDAARGWPLRFDATEPARGFAELQLPAAIRAGHGFAIQGRVRGAAGLQVALQQPGAAELVQAAPDAQGRFRFDSLARRAGTVDYELRLLGADGSVLDRLAVPVRVEAGAALRLMLLSGGPDPDLKYLQRWALDAGHSVSARTLLSRGIAQQRGAAGLDAAALAQTDLVIVDERAWSQLDKNVRTRLLAAVDEGLGLLLRLGGPLPPALAAELRATGLDLRNVAMDTRLQLPGAAESQALQRLPLQAAPGPLQVLAAAADGKPLGVARNRGLGRIGAWWLQGSSALVTSGQAGLHDVLWAQLADALARPRAQAAALLPEAAWRGERSLLCSGEASLAVRAPDAGMTPLLPRRADAQTYCAGFWPRLSGWHELQAGDTRQPFYVRAAEDAPGLHQTQLQAATRVLAGGGQPNAAAGAAGARWPWFLAWLLPATLLWWLQRRPAADA
ncbi:carboxypeptidase regulatory-like domain-containing protein [Tahibacter harae]|uniref:Carboxypeptidase regulatory-like domain-containing protein n=1 Tax=Tahibacter harae TaxID=2963937 RepID=A0ABT1QYG8_9GAMM|nr:carboxypeptidase regulatory-like domain-containing protein [Tahibacter harae]MCQ4167340.1 carboxypeptidase regulatory-like domain-containing protein [Tahibacter harae]